MDTEQILKLNIENIDKAYGGVRGTTLSSRRNLRFWPRIKEYGVRTIIELRCDDHSSRLSKLCEQHGLNYFEFPIDSRTISDEAIAEKLPDFFNIIDEGDFYIACAMGLHRTDIALSVYWMFHGADKGLPPPYLKGHIVDGKLLLERLNNKVYRRLNSLYTYLSEEGKFDIPNEIVFKERKLKLKCEKFYQNV